MKSVLAIGLLALLVSLASAGDASEHKKCIQDAASAISTVAIDAPVQKLVAVSRSIYPDVETMIMQDVPSREYKEALLRVGPQAGCEKIEEHVIRTLEEVVTCYNQELEGDDDGLLDITRADQKAKDVIEAYFACNFARPIA